MKLMTMQLREMGMYPRERSSKGQLTSFCGCFVFINSSAAAENFDKYMAATGELDIFIDEFGTRNWKRTLIMEEIYLILSILYVEF